MPHRTTVCVLLYGDYQPLAARCLHSLLATLPGQAEIRVGLNEIGKETRKFVDRLVVGGHLRRENIVDSPTNLHKYPMMRRLFYDRPIETEFVMWFDDDSYITDRRPDWLPIVEAAMDVADMIGGIYTHTLTGAQEAWLKAQPWYRGRELVYNAKGQAVVSFCTGGWWTARTDILRRFNWPIPELDHRGGDVMLGALCYQQQLQMRLFRRGVAINADEMGRESKAKRRGFDQPPIGYDYRAGQAPTPEPVITPPPRGRLLDLDL